MKTKLRLPEILVLWLFCMLGLVLNAQAQTILPVKKLEHKSFRAYLNKDYDKALAYLYQLDTISSEKAPVYDYWIGLCLLSTDNKLAAVPYLENARKSGKPSFVVNYYLGRAYMYAGRWEEAKACLNAYALEYLARGVKFTVKEKPVSEGHRVHVEKTLQDVYNLLAECHAGINERTMSRND